MRYKIMLDKKKPGIVESTVLISDIGAKIIWGAYIAKFSIVRQTMERRNERGGIAWLSEIESWKKEGYLPFDFDYTQYVVSEIE